jgi:hypothetical protein
MTAEQKISDLCLSYRLEGKLAPLKDNLGNNDDDDNMVAVIAALHSDLAWVLVPASFLQAQPFSLY